MIRTLLFDLDGTLVDNHAANARAYVRAFADVGLIISEADYSRHFGVGFDVLAERLAPELDAVGRGQIAERKRHHYREAAELLKLNQPLVGWLRSMRGHHQTGLATTASRANAEFILEYFHLSDLFDTTVFGEDVRHGKPNPECYQLCLDRLSASPESTLIFEDSEVGIAAADATGAQVVRVIMP